MHVSAQRVWHHLCDFDLSVLVGVEGRDEHVLQVVDLRLLDFLNSRIATLRIFLVNDKQYMCPNSNASPSSGGVSKIVNFISSLIAFLQPCALRDEDFAIYHRKYRHEVKLRGPFYRAQRIKVEFFSLDCELNAHTVCGIRIRSGFSNLIDFLWHHYGGNSVVSTAPEKRTNLLSFAEQYRWTIFLS